MQNKLMTKEVERRLAKFPMGTQDGKAEKVVAVKYFNPYGRGTWYVTEGEKQENGDWLFYGFVDSPVCPDFSKWGYFSLSELMAVKLNVFGLPMPLEREFSDYGFKIDRNGDRIPTA